MAKRGLKKRILGEAKGLELLVDAGKNILDGVLGFFGGIGHATGSAMRGTGYGIKEAGTGSEYGIHESGKGVAYITHGAGHLTKGVGRLIGRLERKLGGDERFIELPQADYQALMRLEPEEQRVALSRYRAARERVVILPRDAVVDALEHIGEYRSRKGREGYHSPLEHAASRYAAVIAIGLALALFIPVTITGASIISQPGSSGIFSAFFIVLGLLGIGALIRVKK